MVKVHCAAIPEGLLASELFGHEKGAFTGADVRKIGKFEQAQGGTIFLDEIGEISREVQVQLLRVLQEREVDRIGGSAPVPLDVRIVAATHRDLQAMVAAGTFREDLFYRLQGMVVEVPPLRDRRRDIPALVEAFRREAIEARQTQVEGFAPEVMDELFRRAWPGNVRQLRNVVFRAMVLASGRRVELEDLTERRASDPGAADSGRTDPGRASGAVGRSRSGARPDAVEPPEDAASAASAVTRSGSSDPSAAGEPSVGARGGAPGTRPAEPTSILPVPDRDASGGASPLPAASLAAMGLHERARRGYQLLAERGALSAQEFARLTDTSARTALRDLNHLVDAGLIERVGARRGARYRLRANSPSRPTTPAGE